MKQLTQVYRTGKLTVVDSPPPLVRPGGVLVRNAASVISPGTERALLEMGRKSLVGKARERPDQVRRLLDKARREGIGPAVEGGLARLNTPVPLGYSSAGVVMEVGEGVAEFQPGDRVACGGAGFAVHAEVVSVPRNLVVRGPGSEPGRGRLHDHRRHRSPGCPHRRCPYR